MKVAFISRATLFKNKGGDTVQIISTAKYLRKLGVEVDIILSNNVSDLSEYHLIHGFNLIRPNDFLKWVDKLKIPFVMSPIFVDYSVIDRSRDDLIGKASKVFNHNHIAYLKTIGRAVTQGEKIGSNYYLLKGHNNSIQKILNHTKALLPNSISELKRIKSLFNFNRVESIIPNGIDLEIFTPIKSKSKENRILCVAQIEPRKNQLTLIKAVNGKYPLTFIGKPAPNSMKYYEECQKAAGKNVSFIDYVHQSELKKFYSAAKVHAMPSWFETTGLSSLEASFYKCSIVAGNKGDEKDYFNDLAFYADPSSIQSIQNAIELAMANTISNKLSDQVIAEYNWEVAASRTLSTYKKILN